MLAGRYYGQIVELTKGGDPRRAEIKEARSMTSKAVAH